MRFHYRVSWLFLNFIERAFFGFSVRGSERIPRSGAVIIASNGGLLLTGFIAVIFYVGASLVFPTNRKTGSATVL